MELFDITNKEQLTINEGTLILTGVKEKFKLTVSPNMTANVVLSEAIINNLEICVLEGAVLNIDYIASDIINIKEEFALKENSSVNFKVISPYPYKDNLIVNLNGINAKFEGKYLVLSRNFNSESTAIINHNAKNTSSNVSNFGISLGNSEIVFETTGKIASGMSKSSCKQLSRGIVYGKKSAVISKPILLIDEYDVSANHGAAIGEMSDDELFYLMSRGLSHDEAFRLILSGIVNPFLDSLINKDNKDKVEESIYSLLKG